MRAKQRQTHQIQVDKNSQTVVLFLCLLPLSVSTAVAVTSMALSALASTFSQALRLTAHPLSPKVPVRRPGRECATGVCVSWDCLSIIGLFVLVLFR